MGQLDVVQFVWDNERKEGRYTRDMYMESLGRELGE